MAGKSKKKKLYPSLILCVMLCFGILGVRAKDGKSKKYAKHVILMIGDGMNIEHEVATSRYLYGGDLDLSFHKLPYQADVSTWDVSAYNTYAGAKVYDPNAINPIIGYDPAQGGKRPYPLGRELPGAEIYHTKAATDSASAATAWATGYKTDSGNLAWLPGDPANGDSACISIRKKFRLTQRKRLTGYQIHLFPLIKGLS